jgi:hypothetical protein
MGLAKLAAPHKLPAFLLSVPFGGEFAREDRSGHRRCLQQAVDRINRRHHAAEPEVMTQHRLHHHRGQDRHRGSVRPVVSTASRRKAWISPRSRRE